MDKQELIKLKQLLLNKLEVAKSKDFDDKDEYIKKVLNTLNTYFLTSKDMRITADFVMKELDKKLN